MKRLFCLTILLCALATSPIALIAGPEPLPSGKEMKQLAPAPAPECNWSGLYVGLTGGGQFGHAEDVNIDGYRAGGPDREWGYDQSGVIAGGEIGYNWQWNWLVLGPEVDLGYMNIDGAAFEPDPAPGTPGFDVLEQELRGRTESDFYATFRGRIGVAFNKWLFYATGGGIGVNWDTGVRDDCTVSPCGSDSIDAHRQDFAWGWTGGGGVEWMLGCHWSVKAEYLFYQLDDQNFSGVRFFEGKVSQQQSSDGTFRFTAHDHGNIVRAGLNYKFW
jgi:outer membrane immunogenic protein